MTLESYHKILRGVDSKELVGNRYEKITNISKIILKSVTIIAVGNSKRS
ncbi:hypothetical protein [Clostridium sp. UBA2485]|nr:hypothetical protein [Clostridium sp. UBA2485]